MTWAGDYEHKNRLFRNSFTDRYNEISDAVKREVELKKWSRKKKGNLINKKNAA